MAKNKTFSVCGKLELDISLDVSAASLEEAVAQSKKLDVDDFVEITGEYNDGNLRITGLFEHD